MVYKVNWEKNAEKHLDEILHYRLTNYSSESASKYYELVNSAIERILKHPESGSKAKSVAKFPVRYVRIGKLHYLYYGIDGNVIRLLALFHVKRNDNPFR